MRTCRQTLAACALLLAAGGTARAERPTAGSVTAERLKLPSGPNSVRGLADEPKIDPFLGQVSHQVPIELPGGWGGLAPELALVYSGALGNGPLGIGWGLPVARIQRALRLGVPRFDDTDELEIQGIASGRLVSIGGGEYRVEGMGQTVRVRRVGAGFEVDDGTGTVHRLGVSASARQGSGSRTLAWLVEEQVNLAGERVTYQYLHDQGQTYLGGATWGPAGAFSVEMVHQARPDQVTSYREGFRVVTARRLAEIRVHAFGELRRSYQLRYDQGFAVSRLAGVDSTGRGGAGAWPSTSFEYAAAAAPEVVAIPGVGTWRLNISDTTLVDLDGDGAADLVQLDDGGHSFRQNQNGAFGPVRALPGNEQSITVLQLQDIDGDARADLLLSTNDGWIVWKYSSGAWTPHSTGWPGTADLALKDPDLTRFADLEGDGLVDAIRWDNDNLKIHRGTLTGFAAHREVERIGGEVLPTDLGRFQDVNGDGLDDYVELRLDELAVYLGRGDGTFDAAVLVDYPFAGQRPNPDDLHLADLDRDGLIDLLRVELGDVRWYRGKTDGTFAIPAVEVANPETRTADVVVAIADSNGNGSLDVVWSSESGMWRMDVAGPTTAGMLVGTQNGLGMDVAFTYRSSHALSAEARLAGDPWTHEVPIAMPVPVAKVTELGPGETARRINYVVRDGYWDVVERRFAGFLGAIVTTWGATPAETASVQTRYHSGAGSGRALRGKVLTEQVRDGTGRRLSLTLNVLDTMAVAGLPDVPLLRRAILEQTRTRHEDTTPLRETRKSYEHDELGRVRREVDEGRLDLTGDEVTREARLADDATTWVRDQTCEEKVLAADGTLVSHVQHFFGDENDKHALCVVGKGWGRETLAYLAEEARFVIQTATDFDAHGNPTAITENGVRHELTYDADGLFVVGESIALADRQLDWSMTWDRVLGVATSLTEPNGHATRATYDSLGRLLGLAVDDRSPHLVVEYDWSAPSPKLTRWEFDGSLEDVGPFDGTWTATGRWRQTVEVSNGLGEVRYRAVRLADDRWIISDYRERDPNSRVTFAGRPVYSGALAHATRPAGMVGDQLVYDPLGRVLEQRLPSGARRVFTYTAFERTMQEDELAPVHSVVDGQGRIVSTERTLADGTEETVDATYDAADRLTQMQLAGGAVVREFRYDSLGRLVETRDPDLGVRTLAWDDDGRLIREENATAQIVRYTYDAAGRLTEREAGVRYRYHYDQGRPEAGTHATRVAGRLAWVEEPTGEIDLGYDELGRTIFARRRIEGRSAEQTTRHAASGLVLGHDHDDGVSLSYEHDPAGRLTAITDLWQVLEQDAAGQILHEGFQNGVETDYERDLLGLVSKVTVRDSGGTALYDVDIARNGWSGITAVTDVDGAGLSHTASFTYDDFARLTAASIGSGASAYSFGYGYDALHNMTSRTAAGPRTLGVLAGTYRYGEGGKGPRQLTSIVSAASATIATFDYDLAGRQIRKDQIGLEYNGLDQLVRATGLPGGTVEHLYGHDGRRVKTAVPSGQDSYFFGEGVAERSGRREHDVVVADRIIARITVPEAVGGTAAASGKMALGLLYGVLLILLGWAAVAALRLLPARSRAAATAAALLACACSFGPSLGVEKHRLWGSPETTFLHAGVGAGPILYTDTTGQVVEERRYEPFGEEIDARVLQGGTYVVGDPDLIARDLNVLNKRTEVTTGWSDHGVRWMAPETARWLTPDPPVKGPDPKFLEAPWALHPYQYVEQNPVAYWDPDGRERQLSPSSLAHDICKARGTCTSGEWNHYHDMASGRAPRPVPPDQVSTAAEREAGFRANVQAASMVPTPGVVMGVLIDVLAISLDESSPVDLEDLRSPQLHATKIGSYRAVQPTITRKGNGKGHPLVEQAGRAGSASAGARSG